ncbi:acyl-CoA carboxylase subunit epsilon [Nocardia asteroides]|uniref:acyl-CoA carboxylase subunit epsilon n=1 Tax=Nocardia asteroides TaxID=1824 RepID=UPI001E539B61|nr:acyl-CoA carboxylase subunit epsilon [Nocardia asteroides]UGT61836.1 acyl-CoA carboxylase subunit epsilon [Nocardia asteroides]
MTASHSHPIRLNGRPSDEEVAAILLCLSAVPAPLPPVVQDRWGSPADLLRSEMSLLRGDLGGFPLAW